MGYEPIELYRKNIIELYHKVKINYDNIINVNDDTLLEIEKISTNDIKSKLTTEFIFKIIAILYVVLVFPIVYIKVTSFSQSLIEYLTSIMNDFIIDNLSFISYTSIVSFVLFILLTFIYPRQINKDNASYIRLTKDYNLLGLHKMQANFVLFKIIGLFFFSFIIAILLHYNFDINTAIFIKFITNTVFLFFAFSLTMSFFALLLNKYYIIDYNFSKNDRIEISFRILSLIELISSENENYYKNPKDDYSVYIYQIVEFIKNYQIQQHRSIKNSNKLCAISSAFQQRVNELLFLEKPNKRKLNNVLVEYFNVFIIGDINELPKKECNVEQNIWKKVGKFLLFTIYFSFPLIVLYVYAHNSEIELTDFYKSLFRIFYILWITFGLTSDTFINENEKNRIFSSILKIITGK